MTKPSIFLTLCLFLTLCGLGFPVLHAQTPPAAAAHSEDDDDDREHWEKPNYAGEARSQMAGTAGIFALTAGVALRRRRKSRDASK